MLVERKLRLADRYELEEGGLYLSGLQALVRIPSISIGSTGGTAWPRRPSSPVTRGPRSPV
jgi:hypothetical protein